MENSDKALNTGAKRVYDVAPSEIFADFMKNGWAPTPLTGITQDEVIAHCVRRRAELSAAFTGVRLVIPSGGPKQRSNDTDYLYRPHTAFAYYTGVQGVEANPDSVLVMDPADGGHTPILFINPRSTRDTSAFYTDAKNGELWVGRRFTTDEASQRYGIEVREIAELEKFLKGKKSAALHGFDEVVDATVKEHPRDAELLEFVSVARLIKDEYEIAEMQKAVDVIVKIAQGADEPVDVSGYETTDAVKLIRGNLGTEVRLTFRKPDGTFKVVSLIREKIVLDEGYARSVVIQNGEDKYGYILLPDFYADFEREEGHRCSEDVAAEIKKLKAEIAEIKERKIQVVKSQQYEQAATLRDEEKKAELKLEKEKQYLKIK